MLFISAMDARNNRPVSVLVVDDEVLVRWSIMEALTKAGFDVTAVVSAEAAFSCLENQRFDVIITDLKLPGEDGFAVARRVSALQPSTGIILISAYADDVIMDQARAVGITGFIPKPLDLSQIIWAVQRLSRTSPGQG